MKKIAVFLALILFCALSSNAQPKPPLTLQQTIPLPGVTGKFDHFAVDTGRNLLFAASTGNHSVEVIDLKTSKIRQSITGLGKPHGLIWVAATSSLYVADGALGELRVYTGTPLALAGKIKLSDDADDMVFDEAHRLLFIGHGTGDAANPPRVAVVDTEHFSMVANLSASTHPEALDIDPQSSRVFANIAGSNEVAVINTATMAVTARWQLTKAADNVPMAFDSEHQLLYVACRTPGTVIALDAATGKEVTSQPAADGADDLFYDPALRRVYVIAGAGEVDSYQVDSAKQLHSLGVVHTVAGAKTALFVPAQNLLYVGVPATGDHGAEIRIYSTPAAPAPTVATAKNINEKDSELRFVVVVSRHGVRSPTGKLDQLNQYSAAPWPKWSVPPGYLTEHGAHLMTLFGAYDRELLAAQGLLAPSGCADTSHIRIVADSDQRTRETGKALAAGIAPGCALEVSALPEGSADPLFHSLEAGVGHPDKLLATAAVSGRIGTNLQGLAAAYRPQLDALQAVLRGCDSGAACPSSGAVAPQSIFDIPASIAPGKGDHLIELHSPLGTASTMAEDLLLEYTEGMPATDVGWAAWTPTSCASCCNSTLRRKTSRAVLPTLPAPSPPIFFCTFFSRCSRLLPRIPSRARSPGPKTVFSSWLGTIQISSTSAEPWGLTGSSTVVATILRRAERWCLNCGARAAGRTTQCEPITQPRPSTRCAMPRPSACRILPSAFRCLSPAAARTTSPAGGRPFNRQYMLGSTRRS